jgi:hypothetical protein
MDDNLKISFFSKLFWAISRNFSVKISTFQPLKLRREYVFYQAIAPNLMMSSTDDVSRFKTTFLANFLRNATFYYTSIHHEVDIRNRNLQVAIQCESPIFKATDLVDIAVNSANDIAMTKLSQINKELLHP